MKWKKQKESKSNSLPHDIRFTTKFVSEWTQLFTLTFVHENYVHLNMFGLRVYIFAI